MAPACTLISPVLKSGSILLIAERLIVIPFSLREKQAALCPPDITDSREPHALETPKPMDTSCPDIGHRMIRGSTEHRPLSTSVTF